jgi:RNA polymerase sigma factor (sigma-70 family)
MTGRSAGESSSPGASGAFVQALEQFRAGLYRFLQRRLQNAQNVEDLAQETYLRLLRASDLGQVKFPQAYLYRVALNVMYEFQVRERGREVSFDSETVAQLAERVIDESAAPEAACEESLRNSRLQEAIAELPKMQRAVLRLAMQQSLSHAEIGQQLGISVSTVRNHLYRAIDFCRHRLADEPPPRRPWR